MNDDGRLDPFSGADAAGNGSDEDRLRAQWQQPDAVTEQQRARQARRLVGRRPLLRAIVSGAGLLASAKALALLPDGPDGAFAAENLATQIATTTSTNVTTTIPVTTTLFVTTTTIPATTTLFVTTTTIPVTTTLFVTTTIPVTTTLFVTTTIPSTTTSSDTTPPAFSLSVNPNVLKPANGTPRPVTVTLTASDSGSGLSHFVLSQVTSNQGLAAGDTSGFVPGTTYPADTTTVSGTLKATITAGAHGRTYTLTFIAYDNAGNSTVRSVTVQVKRQ